MSVSAPDTPLTRAGIVARLAALDDDAARRAVFVAALPHLGADDFLPSLKDESERYLNVDPHAALRIGLALCVAGEIVARPVFRALGLHAMGDALRLLGRQREAIHALDEAGDIFRAAGDEVMWARTRAGWLRSAALLGYGEAALADADEARNILVQHGIWLRAAMLDFQVATVYFQLGRYHDALDRYDRAIALFVPLGPTAEPRIAAATMNKALVLTWLGDFRAALVLHEEARTLYARHGNPVSVLKQEHNIAYIYALQGQYTRALYHYGAVRAAHERAGLSIGVARAARDMVECYLSLNRLAEARDLAEETVARFTRDGAPTEAAQARLLLAQACARLGEHERALGILDAAVAAFIAAGTTAHVGLAVLQRAALLRDTAQWEAARQEATRAGALFAERGLVMRRAQADLVHARAAVELGDLPAAARLARATLAVGMEGDIPWLVHEAHHLVGNIAGATGDLPGALDAYECAVASIEQLQSALAVALRADFLADKMRVYEDAIAASLRLDRPDRALGYLERAKSRALVDYLTRNREVRPRAPNAASRELVNTLARLREEHHGLSRQLHAADFAPHDGDASPASEAALRAALREREREITGLLGRLALEHTGGVGVGVSGPRPFPPLPALDVDTTLVEYYFHAAGGTAFVVSAAGLTTVPLATRLADIRRLLHQWHLNLAATARALADGVPLDGLGRNARGILAALHRALVAPIAAHLVGRERVVFVPYGPTHAVPFHALHDGQHALLETIEVAICPSSDLLALCRARPRPAGIRALIVAHAHGGDLPAVLDEARMVAALFPGDSLIEAAATRAAVAEAAPGYRLVHLAAHGEARLDNPAFAHLALADGQLSMTDIFNLPLDGALVTLSACETGRSVVTAGDELIGLSRGFLHAGASTLVQSLWRVEDRATARLMSEFYGALRAGVPKGAALRMAQRTLLAEMDVHPCFWASFQLVGDWGPL